MTIKKYSDHLYISNRVVHGLILVWFVLNPKPTPLTLSGWWRDLPSTATNHGSSRDGNGAGWVWKMGFSPPPRMVLSYPILTRLRMTGKIFLPHPHPLGPCEAPPHPVKLYFLLIFPSTIFLMKPISLIKIYLKLRLNLSHQIKSIFRKTE